MPICQNCAASFPNRVSIEGCLRNLQNRTFCLACSPFDSHNTKQSIVADTGQRRCPRCQKTLDLGRFYRRRNSRASSPYCKVCTKQQVVERQQQLKQKAVVYKGSQCAHCGYDRYIGSLDFHHVDPRAKEFDLAHFHCTRFEKVNGGLRLRCFATAPLRTPALRAGH